MRGKPFALVAFSCLFAFSVSAVNYSWSGKAETSDWNTASNWTPVGVPANGDNVTISGADVTLGSALQLGSLNIGSSVLSGSGGVTLTQASSIAYTVFNLTGGVQINAQTDIYPAAGADTETLTECSFVNNSTLTVHGNAQFQVNNGEVAQNNGTWIFTPQSSLSLPLSTGVVAFINNGPLYCTNASFFSAGTIFSNSMDGTIFASETNDFEGIFSCAGIVDVATNSEFAVDDSSHVNLFNGAAITGAGVTSVDCAITLSGYSYVNGHLTFLTDGANTPTAITMNGTLEIGDGGSFNWLAGAITGLSTNLTGDVLVDTAGTLIIDSDENGMSLKNVLLTNNGAIHWTNNGSLDLANSALIVNNLNFFLEGDSLLQPLPGDSSPVAVINTGKIQKTVGGASAATTFRVPLNDQARTTVAVGNLILSDGGTIFDWEVNPGATLKMNGGTFTALGGPGILFSGITTFTGAAINIPSAVTLFIGGNFNQSGGTIYGQGVLNINDEGVYQWNSGTISITNDETTVLIQDGGVMNIEGANNTKTLIYGVLSNHGTINWLNDNSAGGINLGDDSGIENFGEFNLQCDAYLNDTSTSTNFAPTVYNAPTGILTKTANTGTSTIGPMFVDTGKIVADSGTIEFYNFSDIYPQPPLPVIVLAGGKIQFDNALTLHADISGSGQINAQHGLTLSGGELTVVVIIFDGNIINDEFFDLGSFFGVLTISGNFSQTGNGVLVIPVQGTNSGGYGKVTASGYNNVNLGGTLTVVLTNGYAPPVGTSIPFLTSYQVSSNFTKLNLPQGMGVTYTSGSANIVVTNIVPALLNLAQVSAGQFQFGFNTITNRSYTVQFKTNLSDPVWTTLSNFVASSSNATFSIPVSSPPTGFIRIAEP